jgi:hypothetical protein
MQVQMNSAAEVEPPDLASLRDFVVEKLGPRTSSSTQISMINGKVVRKVDRRTIYAYRLVPKRAGVLRIPAITVRAGGEVATTRPVTIRASAPQPVKDIQLEADLSRKECYVGEAVTVRWKWYVGQEVRGFQFYIPLLTAAGFTVPEQQVDIDQSQRNRYVRIPLADGSEMIGMKGYVRRGGKRFTVVTFSRVLIPRSAGTSRLSPGTVTCEVFAGMQSSPRRNSQSFFNDFFGGPRKRYRQVVVAAKPLTLKVKPLPAANRPPEFSGIVGRIRINATVDSAEVSVGEPIILTITLSGSDYLRNVDLPSLSRQPDLAAAFKVSDEEPGKIENNTKVFQRTLRAMHAEVKAIPPIRICYFDTKTGAYAEARSKPIPLTVHPTRVVTALDAEGNAPVRSGGKTLKAWTQGVAHNYEDLGALRNQNYGLDAWLRSPAWLSALVGFPGVYFALLIGVVFLRRSRADIEGRQARKAAGRFRKHLAAAAAASSDREVLERLLQAMREYLGAKFAVPSGALLFADIEPRLIAAGVEAGLREQFSRLFELCEAGRYAGAAASVQRDALVKEARAAVTALEKVLK